MGKKLVVAGIIVAAAFAGGIARAASAAPVDPQVSSNWSGYAIVSPDATSAPLSFTDVTGTWVQPRAQCTAGRTSSSAFWVGIGGYDESSQSLEQLGTGADCDGNSATATNYAWWELVPASSVRINLKIFPGDTITAAVLVNGQKITFSLRDVTRKTRFSKVLTTGQPLDTGSAEWIAEAPSECAQFGRCRVVPLTNFGTVTFTKAAAIANGHPGTILDPAWSPSAIELIAGHLNAGFFQDTLSDESGTGAVPGDVTADGRGFSVSFAQNLTPAG
jgi:hypothetical protein